MNKQYYLKDKKAMIYWEKPGGQDKDGFPIKGGYVPFAPELLWCYARQLSQDQRYASAYYDVDESRFFVFNHIPDISVYDFISYRDKWYQITRVDTMDDYKSDMFVYAKDCPEGEMPRPNEVLPYEPCGRSGM